MMLHSGDAELHWTLLARYLVGRTRVEESRESVRRIAEDPAPRMWGNAFARRWKLPVRLFGKDWARQ